MEKYEHTTKYNVGDTVLVINHHRADSFMNTKKIEFCEIYQDKIKSIELSSFGVYYNTINTNDKFKEENVFLETETQELYDRFLELMGMKEEK